MTAVVLQWFSIAVSFYTFTLKGYVELAHCGIMASMYAVNCAAMLASAAALGCATHQSSKGMPMPFNCSKCTFDIPIICVVEYRLVMYCRYVDV